MQIMQARRRQRNYKEPERGRESKSSCSRAESEAEKVLGCGESILGVG